eukprot:symbB.v1.2.003760.t1/scaffold207.1/size268535/7
MDSWTERQLSVFNAGGNKRLAEFFKANNVPDSQGFQRYGTAAADWCSWDESGNAAMKKKLGKRKGGDDSDGVVKKAQKRKKSLVEKIDGPSAADKLLPRTLEERMNARRIVVVLEKCPLELVAPRKGALELLNSDDHKGICAKTQRDLADVRVLGYFAVMVEFGITVLIEIAVVDILNAAPAELSTGVPVKTRPPTSAKCPAMAAMDKEMAMVPKTSRISEEYKELVELEKKEPLLKENPRRWVMFPIQYPAIWEFYKKHEASFWTAEEIDLVQDNKDWEKLSEGERHFVKHVLAFFAASDGIVLENLAAQFSTEVQIPEARAFYGFQIAMENIHSETST